jgi:hypothetical protein
MLVPDLIVIFTFYFLFALAPIILLLYFILYYLYILVWWVLVLSESLIIYLFIFFLGRPGNNHFWCPNVNISILYFLFDKIENLNSLKWWYSTLYDVLILLTIIYTTGSWFYFLGLFFCNNVCCMGVGAGIVSDTVRMLWYGKFKKL